MNEAVIRTKHSDTASRCGVRFRMRFLIYLAVWLLAAVAFEIFLRPEGLTETHLTPLQQRLLWPLYTPLLVFFGLAQAVSTPRDIPQSFFWVVVALLVAHAALTLSRNRPIVFAALIGVQALTLAVAVTCFIHFSRLPHGP